MSKVTIHYKAMMTQTAGFLRSAEIGDRLDDEDARLKGFKMIDVMVDGRSISDYVETCDKVKGDFVDLHTGVQTFIDKLNQDAHIAPFQVEILNQLRQAMVDAICKADQEGYERAVKDQEEAIENHKAYVLPSARFADCGYVKSGRIDNIDIAGVVRPGETLLAMKDEQFASLIEKVKSEPCGSLEIIDDSPFEPEERARYIAKQMINAALDEHMAKLEGGK